MTDVDDFLRAFFGPGNGVSLDDFAERLRPWIDRLRCDPPVPAVLPRQTADGRWVMYALVFDVHQRAQMDARLKAFVGPSWSEFPLGQHLDRADPIDMAVREYSRRWGFKLRLSRDSDALRQVRDALDLMRKCDESRPTGTREVKKPLSRLLYEFDLALSLRNQLSAEEALEALRRSRRLTEENLWFLRIHLLSRFGRWREIDGKPTTQDVARLRRRPHRVTEDLLEAALRAHVRPGETSVDDALEAWKTSVDPIVRGLVREASRPSRASTHLCLMLEAVATSSEAAGDIARQASAAIDPNTPERTLLESLVDSVPSAPEPTAERVRELLEAGEAQAAWLVARNLPLNPEVLRLMYHAVQQAALPEGAEELAEKISTLDSTEADVPEAGDADRRGLTALRRSTEGPPREPCGGWTEWLERAAHVSDGEMDHLAHARERADAWTQAGVGRSSAELQRLVRAFDEAVQTNRSLVRGALPLLLDWLVTDERWGTVALQPLLCDLIDALSLSLGEGIGDLDLSALAELFAAAMKEGLDDGKLAESCSQLASEFESRLRLPLLAAAIDLVEVLYFLSSHRTDLVAPLGAVLARVARKTPHHIPAVTRRSLDELLRDLSLEPVFGDEPDWEEEHPLAWLRGKKVGLYSLNEAAVRRARNQIENALDGEVDVRLEHAKVATASLESMSRQCDVVVMVTGAAKHAATWCIEQNLGPHTRLFRVHAQGTARIMDALSRGPAVQVGRDS